MKPEDIQKELDKFRNKTPVEPGCKLHRDFVPFQLEIFAPPVGTYRMGPNENAKTDIRLDGDKVVVTMSTEKCWRETSERIVTQEVIQEYTFSCEKVEYITVSYAKEIKQ